MENQTIDSTNDARTANNVMRHEYRVLTENEKIDMKAIKDAGSDFLLHLETIEGHLPQSSPCREIDIARQKVEEAVMWAVKAITR